jgi:formylglycine-generating enzyme required for sulfatase activity
MMWIPGGTFHMGSDKHYAEEAPVHRASVSGFWIDRTPVTNRQFKEFVAARRKETASVRLAFFAEVADAAGMTPAPGALVPWTNALQKSWRRSAGRWRCWRWRGHNSLNHPLRKSC